ncbi:MAG: endonuclease/exonuclease/phosphatase family protein [Verrucomicrobia bacterium]|nr:endonuclease/exonuclease/phosphatase family protein [Verrucomicrobiota bacterium]
MNTPDSSMWCRHTSSAILLILSFYLYPASTGFSQSATIPQRTDTNVIVASYNIKWLGDQPHDLDKLAAVIQHFDLCGIIEVKKERTVAELAGKLNQVTGQPWGHVFGFRTHRPHGDYHEAYAVVWRKDRVELGGGVVSNVFDKNEIFRNDPFVVTFRRGGFDFALMLVHTRWTDDPEGTRIKEVAGVANQLNWMKGFLAEQDFIVAGDFNYSGSAPAMKSMASQAGLTQIDPNQKSTFKSDFTGYASPYDHIFVPNRTLARFQSGNCHVMDTTRVVYGDNSVSNMKASQKELSDHLPVWAVFDVALPDDD